MLANQKGDPPFRYIGIRPINGQPDQGSLELDLITELIGLIRSKTDDRDGDYAWKSADGGLSAEYSRSDQAEPGLGGLHIYIEKPGGEATPDIEEWLSGKAGKRTQTSTTSSEQR